MKLIVLSELRSSNTVRQSRAATRNAPLGREMAVVDGKKQVGHKDRIDISVDLKQGKVGYVTHTHPVEGGPGTVLGAFPSGQDLMSSLNFAMRSGHDSISTLTNVFINDPSDVEGMIIWHGPWYTVSIPTNKVNLSSIPRYEESLKSGDFEDSVRLLRRMGFRFEYGYQE